MHFTNDIGCDMETILEKGWKLVAEQKYFLVQKDCKLYLIAFKVVKGVFRVRAYLRPGVK